MERKQKQTILVVDDTPTNIKILGQILIEDYEISIATSGAQALEIIAQNRPDLILLDIMMPEMDGYEVCERVKADRHTQNIPVIFVTAKDEESDEAKGFEIGAVDYITKPVSPPVVKARVKTHLTLKAAKEDLQNQNAILDQKIKNRRMELKASQLEAVERLGLASEYRDEETGLHIKRISAYCRLMGIHLGFSTEENENFAIASTMHDIGKIGIPDHLITKPEKLSEEEWVIMKTHTTIGEELLSGSSSEILQAAAIIAHTHHEKWDGTGYPRRLKGEEIPLPGRIVCICDMFDNLVSKRPYKDSWSIEDSLKEIKKESGTCFDPKLADIFGKLGPELTKILDLFK
ncbi:MAG: two-component system response regulator [Proteobacteria bacterium]|nr:two-component system response regulator [Pseudomonadota bacterium]